MIIQSSMLVYNFSSARKYKFGNKDHYIEIDQKSDKS